MPNEFKQFLDKETYLLFFEDGEKWRFSSNNPALQKWIDGVKNKAVKRNAVKFVVKAAKDYMKIPQALKTTFQNQTGIKTNANDIKTWQTDPIGSLNRYCQKNGLMLPKYEIIGVEQANGSQIVTVKMTSPQGKKMQKSAPSAKEAKRLLSSAYAKDDLKVDALQDEKQQSRQEEKISVLNQISNPALAVQTFLDKASQEDKKIIVDLCEDYRSRFGRKRTMKEFAEYAIGEYRQGVGGAVAFYNDRDGDTQPIWQDTQGLTDIEVLKVMVADVKNSKFLEAQERIAHVKERQNAIKKRENEARNFLLIHQENIDENHRSYVLRQNDGRQYKLNVEYGDIKEEEYHNLKEIISDKNDLRWRSVAQQYAEASIEKVAKPMRTLKVSYEALSADERFEFSSSVEPDVAKNTPQSVNKVFAHNLKMCRLDEYGSNGEQSRKLWKMLISVKDPIIQSEQRKTVLTKPSNQR